MKRFSILVNRSEETNNLEDNSNLNKLALYFKENKNSNLRKISPLLPKKKHSVFINFQYTKGFPLEDQEISNPDLFEETNKTSYDKVAVTQKKSFLERNEKNNENYLFPIKEEQSFDFKKNNPIEDYFPKNQNYEIKEKQEKSKLEKIHLKKQNLLIEIFNSVDLEGKYQKILFVALALSAFICTMMITAYPLQKELPNFECLPADGFNTNEFKKFQFKLIKNEECIVKYCFLNRFENNNDNYNESISLKQESVGKFLALDIMQKDYQDLLNQAKKTLLLVDYSSKKNFVTILDIFCDVEYYNIIFTKILFISRIIGILVYGYISDTYGRKVIFSNGLLIILISNLVFLFFKNVYIYIFFSFLQNLSMNLIQLITITSVESMSKKYYSSLNGVINSLFGISGLVSIFVMYKTQNWNYLLYIHIIFDFIVVALYFKFVVETPLYNLSMKNFKNFINDIVYISKLNGVYEKTVKEKINSFISFCKMYDMHASSEKINLPHIQLKLSSTNIELNNKGIKKCETKLTVEDLDNNKNNDNKFLINNSDNRLKFNKGIASNNNYDSDKVKNNKPNLQEEKDFESEKIIKKIGSIRNNEAKRASLFNLTAEEKNAINKNNYFYYSNNDDHNKNTKDISKRNKRHNNPNITSCHKSNEKVEKENSLFFFTSKNIFFVILTDFKNYLVSIYKRYSRIFKNAESRRTLFFLFFPYFSTVFGYYGQLIFVEKLPGNIFLNSFLIYFSDIISPNIAGYVLRFVGRKKVLTMFHSFTIFISLCLAFLPLGFFYTIVFFTNCFLINFINVCTDIFSTESFDSSIRSSAMGLLILSGFVSNVFADSLMDFFGTFYLLAILSAVSIASIYNLKEPENYLEE